MNMIIGHEVEFLYTDKNGVSKEVRGIVIPNSDNMPENFVTLHTDRGPRTYDFSRIHTAAIA